MSEPEAAPAVEPEAPAPPDAPDAAISAISARGILLGSGPRFARDSFGPILAFYVLYRTVGLAAGIVAATAVALLSVRHEKKNDRSGAMARFSLVFVILQAVIGLASGSARVYLAQPVLLNGAMGLLFLGSAFLGRPLAGVFADEMYPFPPEVRESDTFRRVFTRVSIAWGAYLLVRSAIRLVILAKTSVDAFVLINFATGAPLIAAMVSWSVWYGVRGFRRSDEWGWAFVEPEVPVAPAPDPAT